MKLKLILTYVAVTISIVSYLPVIYLNLSLYGTFRLGLYAIMILLIISSFSLSKISNNRVLSRASIAAIVISILFLCFNILGLNYESGDLPQTIVPLFCLIIGYCSNFSQRDINGITIFYIVSSIIVASLSASTYSTIISMGEYSYLLEGKNQIGAIVAIATALTIYIIPLQKNNYIKYFLIACLIVGVVASYQIECRSAFLAFMALTIYILFKRNSNTIARHFILLGLILVFIYVFYGEQIIAILNDFFVGEKDASSLDEISSGRMDRNEAAVDFIFNHFLFGELEVRSNIPLIHNYLLLKWVRYGFFAVSFVYYYFLFILHAYKKIRSDKVLHFNNIGLCIIIIPYIISLLEPGAPFGPGSIYFFSYILYGFSLSQNKN